MGKTNQNILQIQKIRKKKQSTNNLEATKAKQTKQWTVFTEHPDTKGWNDEKKHLMTKLQLIVLIMLEIQ